MIIDYLKYDLVLTNHKDKLLCMKCYISKILRYNKGEEIYAWN